MERTVLICTLIATSLLSLFLPSRHFKRDLSRSDKIIGVFLLLIPAIGPLLYWFLLNDLPPQDQILQNRGGRGSYTHAWISTKPIVDRIINDKKESLEKHDPQ